MDRDERELLLAGWGIWARDDRSPGWSPRVGSAVGAYLSPGEGEPRPIEIPEPVTEMVDAAVRAVADRLGRWPDLRWRDERLAGVAMAASG